MQENRGLGTVSEQVAHVLAADLQPDCLAAVSLIASQNENCEPMLVIFLRTYCLPFTSSL